MSLLSSDRLVVGLAPARVTLTRVKGLIRPRNAGQRSVECEVEAGVPSWNRSVAALAREAEAMRGGRVRVTVVLSNHFVRYVVVPFNAALSGEGEALAYARFHFTRIYGDAAASWHIRVARSGRGTPCLASAVDQALIDALHACFPAGSRQRLVSVQPWLMPAYNRQRGKAAWMLLVEPGRACLACAPGGRWVAVQTTRGGFESPETWPALLERALLQCDGVEPSSVLVGSAAGAGFAPFSSGRWHFSAAAGVGKFAMAPGVG